MPSPFPGMNPYFEQPAIWHDFHTEFIIALRRELAPRTVPIYVVQINTRISEENGDRIPFLEIRDRAGWNLVTVLELLSPSDRRIGDDPVRYLGRRRASFSGQAHRVEIDLLRGEPRVPRQVGSQDHDYSILVSRADRRLPAALWKIRLRDRLPEIPVPLREPDEDASVDLQQVLHRTYDGPGYEHFIYDHWPEPRLSAEDAAWAQQFVPKG